MTEPVGVVLAGGASRRMGTDKAFVAVDGRSMVLRVADALVSGGCGPLVCQGGDPRRLAAVGLDLWPDVSPPEGPVGAIRSALGRAVEAFPEVDVVVVAACDLPFLNGGVVRSLVAAATGSGRAAVATTSGRPHLVAAWPVLLSTVVARAADSGVTTYRQLVADVPSVELEVAESAVVNVNRPGDVPVGDVPETRRGRHR